MLVMLEGTQTAALALMRWNPSASNAVEQYEMELLGQRLAEINTGRGNGIRRFRHYNICFSHGWL